MVLKANFCTLTDDEMFCIVFCCVQSTSLHGDPAAALLEVLDPEQNHNFVDQYPCDSLSVSYCTHFAILVFLSCPSLTSL